jgi:hypothetical protein
MWIIRARQHISPKLTVKGFTKCCISNATNGTDDDMLWNDSEEDEDARSVCKEDEGTDFEDGKSDTY